jgi:acetoin utilization protein AcuC
MLPKPLFIGSEIYRASTYGAWHPLRVPRVSTVMDLSRALGWLPDDQYIQSPRAKPAALHAWHRPDYIDALQAAEAAQEVSDEVRRTYHIGTPANPVFPEIFRRPATAAGGSILAGELLKDGGIVYNPAGGTHHGMPDRANGFCYLNDPVLAMLSLRRNGVKRIAYIDIDAHHPDGVEHGFQGDPDILMISTHQDGIWPRTGGLDQTGGGRAFNLPLPTGACDDDLHFARDQLVLPAVVAFKPEAIVLQCGADAVEEDPQSRLKLSNQAHWGMLQGLMGLAPRLLVLGGGGYNPWSVGRLWTGVWGILCGQDIPNTLPPPAETVLRELRFEGNSRGRNPPDHWFTTLADAPRHGPISDQVRDSVAFLKPRLADL